MLSQFSWAFLSNVPPPIKATVSSMLKPSRELNREKICKCVKLEPGKRPGGFATRASTRPCWKDGVNDGPPHCSTPKKPAKTMVSANERPRRRLIRRKEVTAAWSPPFSRRFSSNCARSVSHGHHHQNWYLKGTVTAALAILDCEGAAVMEHGTHPSSGIL